MLRRSPIFLVARWPLLPREVMVAPLLRCTRLLHSSVTGGLNRESVRYAAFSAAPRRWCTTTGGPSSTSLGIVPPPSPSSFSSPSSSSPSISEQLQGLSPEDQVRILNALQHPEKEKSSKMGGTGIGPADGDMVAAFTCGPCEYRMVKRFSKHAYQHGIVIVECPNCRVKHLLADNLGWLEDKATTIEDLLREKGESFTRIGGPEGSDYQVTATPAKEE